ncbi:MAG: hypothetical protein L6R43_00650 [Planctomycetes bacterium]|nr:hypothetical protein [Planctomycetota bacterium]
MNRRTDSELERVFRRRMLSPEAVVTAALEAKLVGEANTVPYIKANFSQLLEDLQRDAHAIYTNAERNAGEQALREVALARLRPGDPPDRAAAVLAGMFDELNAFFLSRGQSRKSRAGGAFETLLHTLFRRLDYPFTEQAVINGKPDFLMPSEDHYRRYPMDCIIFTAKRTLRERWRQIVTEGTRGLGFYLATIDEKVSTPQLGEMLANRIHLVVPASIKARVPHYAAADNVLPFEEFFRRFVDPKVQDWRERGISHASP